MQAPGWDRRPVASRWAPAVALLVGSLAFIALAVLLIPTQFITMPRTAETAGSSEQISAPARPAPFRTALSAAEDPSPIGSPVSAAVAAPSPAARLTLVDAGVAAQSIFAPNIAARGDRPTPPVRRATQ